ncbi:hypothetical protein MRX96_015375 [Rhipicephalus microplus]
MYTQSFLDTVLKNHGCQSGSLARPLWKCWHHSLGLGDLLYLTGRELPKFAPEHPDFMWLEAGNYTVVEDFAAAACDMWKHSF